MFKRILIALVLSLVVACGGNAPEQRPKPSEPYVVLSSLTDPATNSFKLMIKVDPPITEEDVKKAVEIAIEKHKGQFQAVTVNSYTTHNTNTTPYAVSRYDSSSGVTHQFNSQAAPQKIPSH
jgi:hypothetical protein